MNNVIKNSLQFKELYICIILTLCSFHIMIAQGFYNGSIRTSKKPNKPQKEKIPQRESKAIFFAIDQYKEWSDLKNPVNDAETIKNDLEQLYNFKTETIPNATRNQIYEALKNYQKQVFQKEDQLFIYFSGHGDFVNESSDGYFIPSDGKKIDPYQDSYISLSKLTRIINNIPCDHIFLVIDACYSGTLDESLAMKGQASMRRPKETDALKRERFISKKLKSNSRLFLTSGGKERTPDGNRYSPLTIQILEALRRESTEDGILTFQELVGYTENVIPLPHFGHFGKNEPGGSFLFIGENLSNGYSTGSYNTTSVISEKKEETPKQNTTDCANTNVGTVLIKNQTSQKAVIKVAKYSADMRGLEQLSMQTLAISPNDELEKIMTKGIWQIKYSFETADRKKSFINYQQKSKDIIVKGCAFKAVILK